MSVVTITKTDLDRIRLRVANDSDQRVAERNADYLRKWMADLKGETYTSRGLVCANHGRVEVISGLSNEQLLGVVKPLVLPVSEPPVCEKVTVGLSTSCVLGWKELVRPVVFVKLQGKGSRIASGIAANRTMQQLCLLIDKIYTATATSVDYNAAA